MVAVLAVTLLGTGLARLKQRARCGQLEAGLRSFAAALEEHHEKGRRWPMTAEETGALLRDLGWAKNSPVGGSYGWIPPAPGQPGRITLTAFHPAFPLAITRTELRELDGRIDDGDLATGRFRTGFNGWPVYLVGEKP
ncbi:MAG: hypothetical protein PSW75_07735 [bacterium]|nr:hypothetical protein [bacterium]